MIVILPPTVAVVTTSQQTQITTVQNTGVTRILSQEGHSVCVHEIRQDHGNFHINVINWR